MKKQKHTSRKLALLLFLILIVSGIGIKTLADAGELDTIWDHPLPDCRLVAGVTGAEDLASVDNGTRVLISATDRQKLSPEQKSGVYLYNGSTPPTFVLATDGNPQGISAVATGGGTRIFLVVHKSEKDVVQIFDWVGNALTLVKEVAFEGVTALNGIVGIDTNRFFVSQELGMNFALGREVEKLLRLPLGKLWFYDGEAISLARDRIIYPNGLALSPDKKVLYLASMLGSSLIVFDLEEKGTLRWHNQLQLHTAPDNLKWSGESLLVGTHPQLLHLMAHSHNAKGVKAPAQLISIEGLPEAPRVVELFSSREGPLSAVTGAVPMGQRLIMGAVYDEGILDCGTKP